MSYDSYGEYLQRKRHDDVIWRLDEQNLNLVASREELSRRGLQVREAIETGSQRVGKKIDAQGRAIQDEVAKSSQRISKDLPIQLTQVARLRADCAAF